MTAQRGDFDSPHTDRTTEDDDVFDAHLAGWESAPAVDIAADVREASPLAFAEWVVSLDDDDPGSQGRIDRRTVTLNQIIGHARAAISADPGPDTADQLRQRAHELADRWVADADRADDAEPATRDDLSRMIAVSRWSRQHAAEVFIVVDPVQDYDESPTLLGVHGSLAAAKRATGRYRQTAWCYSHGDDERRVTEVQRWKGDQLLDVWTYRPETRAWTWSEPSR